MSLKSKQKVHTPLPGPHLLVCLRIVGEGPSTNWCKKRRCKTSTEMPADHGLVKGKSCIQTQVLFSDWKSLPSSEFSLKINHSKYSTEYHFQAFSLGCPVKEILAHLRV